MGTIVLKILGFFLKWMVIIFAAFFLGMALGYDQAIKGGEVTCLTI